MSQKAVIRNADSKAPRYPPHQNPDRESFPGKEPEGCNRRRVKRRKKNRHPEVEPRRSDTNHRFIPHEITSFRSILQFKKSVPCFIGSPWMRDESILTGKSQFVCNSCVIPAGVPFGASGGSPGTFSRFRCLIYCARCQYHSELDARAELTDYPSMKLESEMSVRPLDKGRILSLFILLLPLACIVSTSCNRSSAASTPPERNTKRGTTVHNPMLDSDEDGLPDGAELRTASERENFRRWFTAIAESQFYRVSDTWVESQQDCAGLVRFSLREALRQHDRAWMKAFGEFDAPVAPDPRAAKLTDSVLGERLFRTTFGAFKESELTDETFSEFADARTLKNFNVNFVGRDRRLARSGDLLFFHQPWVQSYPFHVMIFLGEARDASEAQATGWFITPGQEPPQQPIKPGLDPGPG
jgi:uncharacterized protein YfaT (DUF1175 family)